MPTGGQQKNAPVMMAGMDGKHLTDQGRKGGTWKDNYRKMDIFSLKRVRGISCGRTILKSNPYQRRGWIYIDGFGGI